MERVSRIQAVLVLYRLLPHESPAYVSLQTALQVVTGTGMTLMVCDNTPGEVRSAPADFLGHWESQPNNPGLASSYNLGLAAAAHNGAEWLLLLDQDTVVTPEYLREVSRLALELEGEEEVVAIAPKLIEFDKVQSPHLPLRWRRRAPLSTSTSGIADDDWIFYNSGSLLRVSALQTCGGFPGIFWLDFLDHAIYRRLRLRGGKVWVTEAKLQHELSSNEAPRRDAAYLARTRNIREAENLYYRMHGTPSERAFYRWRTLWEIGATLKRGDTALALHHSQLLLRSWRRARP